MEEKKIENTGGDGGQLVYIPYQDGFAIKRYRGIGACVEVPSHIEGSPVTAIEKKAFLSCKTIREIRIPDTIEEIGDWAFAHTEKLKTIHVPNHSLRHGKELFLGCKRLREIVIAGTDEDKERRASEGIGRMLAMAVTVLHDYFLFAPDEAETDAWLARWDEKLKELMELDDLDGFEELWTCGEEDYEGKDYDIKSYPVEKRKLKLRIAYFRLLHPYRIADSMKAYLMGYLSRHTKGTATPEAWDIIIEEHKNELAYYKVFAEAGCITEDNFDGLLSDMQDVGAEIKAYLLRYKEEHFRQRDAFAAFELDW